MKVSPTKSIIWIAGLSILMGVIISSILGIISAFGAVLILSITGLIYGLIVREKKIWKPFLLAAIITVLAMAALIFLVSISDM